MTKYNVHLFREMRLHFPGIEAESAAEAAEIASRTDSGKAEGIADCEGENLSAVVDVAKDAGFASSTTMDFEPQRLLNAAPKMIAALQAVLPYAESELASLRECHRRDGGLEDEVAASQAAIEQAREAMELVEGGMGERVRGRRVGGEGWKACGVPAANRDLRDLSAENAVLRGALWLANRALKGYHDAKHVESEDGRPQLTVPESLRTKAAEAIERAERMLRDEGRGR